MIHALFAGQQDFVYFFYGLAFVLLGATCVAIARDQGPRLPWEVLGLFGFSHGLAEWLGLVGTFLPELRGIGPLQALVTAVSLLFLLEFARSLWAALSERTPRVWISGLLLTAVVISAALGGWIRLGWLNHFVLAPAGAAMVAVALFGMAGREGAESRAWLVALATFVLAYGITEVAADVSGIFALEAGAWRSGNQASVNLVHFVEGVLGYGMAAAVWGYAQGIEFWEVVRLRRGARRRYFLRTLVSLGLVLAAGWSVTQWLGGVAHNEIYNEAVADAVLFSDRIESRVERAEKAVSVLAGSPWIARGLTAAEPGALDQAESVLNRYSGALPTAGIFFTDSAGVVIASSDNGTVSQLVGRRLSATQYFLQAVEGRAGWDFAVDPFSGVRAYYASHPVRDPSGALVGVAVIREDLAALEPAPEQCGICYLVSPEGIAFLGSAPRLRDRTLWPLPEEGRSSPRTDRGDALDERAPVLAQPVHDGDVVNVDGSPHLAARAEPVRGGWHVLVLKPYRPVIVYRMFGITVSLLLGTLIVLFFAALQRKENDRRLVEEKQSELEEVNRLLELMAGTDPLTGLPNRQKFDEILSAEVARARRLELPLSVIMLDIDHFKQVNDRFGHQLGDRVLSEFVNTVQEDLREYDELCRWGGEEFTILAPNTDAAAAAQLAERIRARIERHQFPEVQRVTSSFGVTELRADDNADRVADRADDALYQAKRDGRNCVRLE